MSNRRKALRNPSVVHIALAVALAGATAGVAPALPAAATTVASHVPGTFVVTMKAQMPGTAPAEQRQFARLAIYSFREPSSDPAFMNLRMDLWYWDTNALDSDTIDACPSGSLIGHVLDGSDPYAADADKSVKCASRGLTDPRQTRFGTYCGPDSANPNVIQPGDEFTIYWHDTVGNTTPGCGGPYYERWRYSSRMLANGNLAMIEMLAATTVDPSTSFYAASSPYNPDALNVGWGFGSRGIGPKGGRTLSHIAGTIIDNGTTYRGYWKPWNNWCADSSKRNESVRPVSIVASQSWKLTDGTYNGAASPKLRHRDQTRSSTKLHDVFSYIAVPDNQPPFTNRRINMQVGHDWNDNGHIYDGDGHAQSGLQIIDATGAMVGFVSVEVGRNGGTVNGGRDTLSSLYYLRGDMTPSDPVGVVRC